MRHCRDGGGDALPGDPDIRAQCRSPDHHGNADADDLNHNRDDHREHAQHENALSNHRSDTPRVMA